MTNKIDLKEKIADWKECKDCKGKGCIECNFFGYIYVDR